VEAEQDSTEVMSVQHEYRNGAIYTELQETLARIEDRVTKFEMFYSKGLEKLDHLDKTHQDLNSSIKDLTDTIQGTVDGLVKQASGIVPGGLIPVRSAFLMVIIALGIAKAGDIGTHITHILHALMGTTP
jgi:hypothetical protein